MRSAALWVLGASLLLASSAAGQELEWRTDLRAATAEAAREGKPLLVVFR